MGYTIRIGKAEVDADQNTGLLYVHVDTMTTEESHEVYERVAVTDRSYTGMAYNLERIPTLKRLWNNAYAENGRGATFVVQLRFWAPHFDAIKREAEAARQERPHAHELLLGCCTGALSPSTPTGNTPRSRRADWHSPTTT